MSTDASTDQLRSLFAALHGLADPNDVNLRVAPASSPGVLLSCQPAATSVVASGAPGEALAALETTVRDLALARLERLAGALGYAFVETLSGPALAAAKPQVGAAGPGLTREADVTPWPHASTTDARCHAAARFAQSW